MYMGIQDYTGLNVTSEPKLSAATYPAFLFFEVFP